MDLTGLSRKRINQLAGKAAHELDKDASHEFSQLDAATIYPRLRLSPSSVHVHDKVPSTAVRSAGDHGQGL
jgi:hypothetical protein